MDFEKYDLPQDGNNSKEELIKKVVSFFDEHDFVDRSEVETYSEEDCIDDPIRMRNTVVYFVQVISNTVRSMVGDSGDLEQSPELMVRALQIIQEMEHVLDQLYSGEQDIDVDRLEEWDDLDEITDEDEVYSACGLLETLVQLSLVTLEAIKSYTDQHITDEDVVGGNVDEEVSDMINHATSLGLMIAYYMGDLEESLQRFKSGDLPGQEEESVNILFASGGLNQEE